MFSSPWQVKQRDSPPSLTGDYFLHLVRSRQRASAPGSADMGTSPRSECRWRTLRTGQAGKPGQVTLHGNKDSHTDEMTFGEGSDLSSVRWEPQKEEEQPSGGYFLFFTFFWSNQSFTPFLRPVQSRQRDRVRKQISDHQGLRWGDRRASPNVDGGFLGILGMLWNGIEVGGHKRVKAC